MSASKPRLRDIFGRRLRAIRTAAGLSQRELGRRIGLLEEVVSSRVTRYELGTSEPDFETVSRLAMALDVPMAYLLADNEAIAEIILAAWGLPVERQREIATVLRNEPRKRSKK
jgi:transcriptional regulator with XRE-family HTH domain